MRCAARALFVACARATREASARVADLGAGFVATAFLCACGFGSGFAAVELAAAAGAGAASVIVATAVCVSAVATFDALAPGARTSVGCLLAPCGRRAAL
jgi:hypothetical protein